MRKRGAEAMVLAGPIGLRIWKNVEKKRECGSGGQSDFGVPDLSPISCVSVLGATEASGPRFSFRVDETKKKVDLIPVNLEAPAAFGTRKVPARGSVRVRDPRLRAGPAVERRPTLETSRVLCGRPRCHWPPAFQGLHHHRPHGPRHRGAGWSLTSRHLEASPTFKVFFHQTISHIERVIIQVVATNYGPDTY
jgi:hypothetical protein